jgi:hypothetical protein
VRAGLDSALTVDLRASRTALARVGVGSSAAALVRAILKLALFHPCFGFSAAPRANRRAMATALTLATDAKRRNGRWQRGSLPAGNGESPNSTWQAAMKQAGAVLDHAPDLAPQVVSGDRGIYGHEEPPSRPVIVAWSRWHSETSTARSGPAW